MSAIALILIVALLIPLVGILLDSPIGRALARRLDRPEAETPALADLARKVEHLESEVDDLARVMRTVQDENAFLQRLLEKAPARGTLPPPPRP